jgi:hypothetical protein
MKSLAEKGPARSDATAKLLLLLARDVLPERLASTAHHLCEEVSDWDEFFRLSANNASLPFVYKHLFALKPKPVPHAWMVEARLLAIGRTIRVQKLTAAMTAFHHQCIAPVNASHVYMKGPALAQQFYEDPALRSCSDIDILVSESDYAKVAQLAFDKGYRFLLDPTVGSFVTSADDLSFIIRYADVISMFDQDNMHIELHRYIEKTTPIFPVSRIMAEAQQVTLGRATIQTLSTAWHFVYITYHHSRHFWSRLHWVADLHALMSHPTFKREEVLKLANEVGLLPTVQAAIELSRLTVQPEEWPANLGKTPGGIFLDACLRGLPGDSAFELESWDAMFLFDFGDQWQFDSKRKFIFWGQSALRRLQPTVDQYLQNPRPRSMEWLYAVENMSALAGNLYKRISA